MKILHRHIRLSDSELSFVVELRDVGKTFLCKAHMIPYSCGSGAMSHFDLVGDDCDDVALGYRMEDKLITCNRCDGWGIVFDEIRKGVFGRRRVTVSLECDRCHGKGKITIQIQVPII